MKIVANVLCEEYRRKVRNHNLMVKKNKEYRFGIVKRARFIIAIILIGGFKSLKQLKID